MTFIVRIARRHIAVLLVGIGLFGLAASFALDVAAASEAIDRVWPPFVLVTGLLAVGYVANAEGLFEALGVHLARVPGGVAVFYVASCLLIVLVTALLNLDTSVAFLTPILIYAARTRSLDAAPFLYGCLLLSNAGSLLLPGANLTNLIIISPLHLTGMQFLSRTGIACTVAVTITALGMLVLERPRETMRHRNPPPPQARWHLVSIVGVIGVGIAVLVLPSPALAVFAIGILLLALRLLRHREPVAELSNRLGLNVLIGLFAVAVSLGTLGRAWNGPATFVNHLNAWGSAAIAACASVFLNNLPAASLLAARTVHHPFAVLVGLNVGPNLFATGSLSWVLWLKAAKETKERVSVVHASRLGLLTAPFAMAGAILILVFVHTN